MNEPRPPGAPRFDAHSPKLKRQVSLYSGDAFEQWVLLEADPEVERFCERPCWTLHGGQRRLVDFWVRASGADYGLLLLDGSGTDASTGSGTDNGAGLPLRTVSRLDLLAKARLIANWRMILPYLTANGPFVTGGLLADILGHLATPLPLGDLERRLALAHEPMLARTGVFHLLHRGRIVAPSLAEEPLGPRTVFGGA